MTAPLPRMLIKIMLLAFAGVALVILLLLWRRIYLHQQTKKTYTIGVIINKTELPSGGLTILKETINRKLKIINEQKGIEGHPIQVTYIDDQNDDKKLYDLVEQTSKDPNLIAFVGCRGVSRGKTIGPLLTEKRIPFIGLYAFTHLFKDYPTMYTASVGVKEGKLVFQELFKAKAKHIAVISEKDNLLSLVFLQAMEDVVARNPELSITLRRTFEKGHLYNQLQDSLLADSLRSKADFILFLSNLVSCNSFLDFMHRQNLKIPMYVGSPDLPLVDAGTQGYRAAEIYAINTFGIPGAQNMRMMEQFTSFHKNRKYKNEISAELSITCRIADEIGLIHEAAQSRSSSQKKSIRERINDGLKQYINGNQIYHGWLADWYFTPEHAYAGETLMGWKPRNQTNIVLAPYQYLRKDTILEQKQALFTNLNMVEISQVNDDDGTFYATFYLEINSPKKVSLQNIDFTNAVRNEINHEALIETKLIRSKRDPLRFQFYNNLYQVSGKFFFDTDLEAYPLDQQKFPISIQASNPNNVFLVQPAQIQFRDSVFESKGWEYVGQYMGYDQDIISSAINFYAQKRNIPYYKFSYVYIMKRAHIDFFLKTLVPLLAILVITYFSVYIPLHQFEALAGIQVTALLSSIALYFSAYKPLTDYATTSDRIFIFSYIMITTLIGTSILLYTLHHRKTIITPVVRFYQRYVFPVLVLGFTIYVRWF